METAFSKLIVIAAGGTGGHIFPALSTALQIKKDHGNVSLLWIGTARSREAQVCEKHGIPLVLMDVSGLQRKIGLKTAMSLMQSFWGFSRSSFLFRKTRPAAIIAFGGYVCAPVLAAARIMRVPYFVHEQNTVPGMVNRVFASHARMVFAGMPLISGKKLGVRVETVGTPVRRREDSYESFAFPEHFKKTKKTILICGGSQGAQSMNECLKQPALRWAAKGIQIVWQTGEAGHQDVRESVGAEKNIYVFPTIDDLYPYYSLAQVVVGRAGASTIAELAYFGLPCVLIPLPWAADNHQWTNAGVVEGQGWGIRVKQDTMCRVEVDSTVMKILTDKQTHETMKANALEHSPADAAKAIVRKMMEAIPL
jgi:UDP-N-acetylglucosamine--N-acetylmuramyl-(pentapeptide) pyrophosphoryl-undecaprenol N-acetylglucosamine transferase